VPSAVRSRSTRTTGRPGRIRKAYAASSSAASSRALSTTVAGVQLGVDQLLEDAADLGTLGGGEPLRTLSAISGPRVGPAEVVLQWNSSRRG
jgi:hypothetical protein